MSGFGSPSTHQNPHMYFHLEVCLNLRSLSLQTNPHSQTAHTDSPPSSPPQLCLLFLSESPVLGKSPACIPSQVSLRHLTPHRQFCSCHLLYLPLFSPPLQCHLNKRAPTSSGNFPSTCLFLSSHSDPHSYLQLARFPHFAYEEGR